MKREWCEARPKDVKAWSELGSRSGIDDLCWGVLKEGTDKVIRCTEARF